MQRACPGDRVTDGDRVGVVIAVLCDTSRGLGGGSNAEAQVRWDATGETSFECIEDLMPEVPDGDR